MRIAVCKSNKSIEPKSFIFKALKIKFKSSYDWEQKFGYYLSESGLEYDYIDIDNNDWIEKLDSYDLIIWKPGFMGIRSSQFIKEKIYFIQYIMKKRVYPNFETIWHFDSKVAQKYIFEYQNIKAPETFVSHDYQNTIEYSTSIEYPVVVKSSSGAGSTGVKLIKSQKHMNIYINRLFVMEKLLYQYFNNKYFDRFSQIYIQKFLPKNDSDLRITIIGNRFAVGFWRNNRENDFRASGSGSINYKKEIPKNIISYCHKINEMNKFDSMAYDILFNEDAFVIVEMSYGYNAEAIYNAGGYYKLDSNGAVIGHVEENTWPQELWIKWILEDQKLSKGVTNCESNN